MKVLYFSRDYTTHDRRFLEAIASRHETFFLRLDDDGIRYEARGVPTGVVVVPWPTGGAASAVDRRAALSAVLDALRPDVVHAGPIPTCAALAADTGYGRLVSMSWGSDVLVDAHASPALTEATVRALAASAFVVCDCDAVRRACVALQPVPDERIVQFPWGLRLADYPDTPRRARSDATFRVLSTRTWSEVYGVPTVLGAFAWAYAREPSLRLCLVGDGPLAAELDARIRSLGIENVVERPGRLDQAALQAALQAADVYLSASRSDGTSISLLEAMALRLPVIVSDVGGNPEWVETGERGNGWLAPVDDEEAFGAALLAAARASDREDRGARGRSIVEARASWDQNVERLHAAYAHVASEADR